MFGLPLTAKKLPSSLGKARGVLVCYFWLVATSSRLYILFLFLTFVRFSNVCKSVVFIAAKQMLFIAKLSHTNM